MCPAILRCLAVVTLAACLASADTPPKPPGKPDPKAPARPAVDYVKELFEDYFEGAERTRFFEAAGVDGMLSREEFQAAAGKSGSFVRAYDLWDSAAPFDKDRDGKLSWQEAEAYRLSVQKRVLALFDKDKDGKLAGSERDVANAFLAGNRARLAVTSQPAGARLMPASAPRTWTYEEMLARSDGGVTGQFVTDEYHASYEAFREDFQRRELADYDADGDGQFNELEQKKMQADYDRLARQWQQHWDVVRWDADSDGKLSAQERQVMAAENQRVAAEQEQRRKDWLSQLDLNEDGVVSPDEERAVLKRYYEALDRRRREIDADGDGKLSADEIWAYRQKLFEELKRRREQAVSRAADAPPGR